MNKLIQTDNMLIACEGADLLLEEREHARLLVISDTHGEAELLESIVLEFGENSDALVFCGDGFCDIAAILEKAALDRRLRESIPPVIASVRGNGDADQYAVLIPDPETEEAAPPHNLHAPTRILFRAAGRTVLVVHGHAHGVAEGTGLLAASADTMDADLIFYGHTHIPLYEESGPTLIINPGSCARPRGGYPPTFAVVSFPGTTERFEADFFEVRRSLFGSLNFSAFSWNFS